MRIHARQNNFFFFFLVAIQSKSNQKQQQTHCITTLLTRIIFQYKTGIFIVNYSH